MPDRDGQTEQKLEAAALRGDTGVVIAAQNGDVIRYDHTGLVMRLADSVIDDIAARLETTQQQPRDPSGPGADGRAEGPAEGTAPATLLDAEILGDIDAWHVIQDGEWLRFQANLAKSSGPRGFRKPLQSGDIIADAPGAVLGMLSIGGPRRAVGIDGAGDFPYHLVAPDDDIGGAGLTGSATAHVRDGFSQLSEQTRDALTAQAILHARQSGSRALPLIMVRCEADQSATADALASGPGFDNLMTAAASLAAAAKSMGKKAQLLAVGLDYCIEDVLSSDSAYRDGIYALMRKIELGLGQKGFRKPRFVSLFECGDGHSDAGCHTQAQWELATNPAGFDLIYTAPGYMFEQTAHRRLTAGALAQMAEMDACAIEACLQMPRTQDDAEAGVGQWCCPSFLLAERQSPPSGTNPPRPGQTIRVTANAMSALVIDETADFGAPVLAGFRLENVENNARLVGVRLCPDQPLDLLLVFFQALDTAP